MKEILELINEIECELDDSVNSLPEYSSNTDSRSYIDGARNTLYVLKEKVEEVIEKANAFEKGLLLLCLLSYLQAFEDGNKRTARIISNAVLMNYNFCPLSFRSVSAIDYKKAMLLFYEQNNISAMKQIFIDQYEFAVNQYFDL